MIMVTHHGRYYNQAFVEVADEPAVTICLSNRSSLAIAFIPTKALNIP